MELTGKRTKIVATISDRKCDVDFLTKLFAAGMNVVRLNTAHQNHADTLKVITNVRQVSENIPLLLDTKGPEIRTNDTKKIVELTEGQKIDFIGDKTKESTDDCIYVNYDNFEKDIKIGETILIDDGEIAFSVDDKTDEKLICTVKNSGIVKGRKSVNVPGSHIDLPSLSSKDIGFIDFAIDNDIDFIAHSFVRNKEDVLSIQRILDKRKSKIKIIAKIENREGVDNLDEILEHAYGVMIARGDLGIEIPAEEIPSVQKEMIQKCVAHRTPVIVATQMLHTMIENPRPTRAEVSDVANAVYDGTDAIMLSGETAYGEYPIEAVETMTRIAKHVESRKEKFTNIKSAFTHSPTSSYLSKAAVKATIRLDLQGIVSDTMSGRTIRSLASYRGLMPVFAMCYDKTTMRELGLSYGVQANYIEPRKTTNEFYHEAFSFLFDKKYITINDKVVILAGNFGPGVGASFIEISEVKHLIER